MSRILRFPSPKGGIAVAAIVLAVAAVLFMIEPAVIYRFGPHAAHDDVAVIKRIFVFRSMIVEAAIFVAAYALVPAMKEIRFESFWRRRFSIFALIATSLFIAVFVFYYGNLQFGAWDYSIDIDTGWRQIQGQRPYIDFITPNPPGFNLGVYWAFKLFGVRWNSQLFAIIFFSVTTFLWMYWLLRRFPASRPVSLLVAFTVECVTVLPVCFWWYNDTTAVLGAVFLLSAMLCGIGSVADGRTPENYGAWLSYAVSLGLLCLMKPNIAGLLIAPTVLLLFIAVRPWWTVLWATMLGCILAIGVLYLNHVSIPDMIASYRAAAIERGGLSRFGLITLSKGQQVLLFGWTLALAVPLISVLPRLREALRERRWQELSFLLLLLLAFPVTLYGMATNGEVKDSETSVLVIACAMTALVLRWTGPQLRAGFIAFLISMIVSNLYFGEARQRVFGIMNHGFYEYFGADQPVRDGFFGNLTATPYFEEVQTEIRRAVSTDPGPIFLGPRLEFDYADLQIPSPTEWPVYYQPGTSFARRDIPRLNAIWEQHSFQTLIFLGDDRTYYPDELLHLINVEYVREPGYKDIQVYRRKNLDYSK